MADEPPPLEPPGTDARPAAPEPGPAPAATASGQAPDAAPGVARDAADVEDVEPEEETPHVPDLVLDALAEGPATGFEITRRLENLSTGVLGSREGYLYPLLFEMRRDGHVESRWVDRPDGRRRLYALAGSTWPDTWPPSDLDTSGLTPTRAMRRIAEASTEKLGFAPSLAEETRAELLRHVLDGSVTLERAGESRADAEHLAIRALGDPWKIATDLARAASGRRTVIFPRSAGESALSLGIYDLGILVAILGAIVFLRVMVVAVYHIPTKSMEPTLHGDRDGGDRILVLRTAGPPRRFDIEVFEGWGPDRKQYVKRCTGLPGEELQIFSGDLWIDRRLVRKEGDDLEAMLFPLYDLEVETAAALREKTSVAQRMNERWTWKEGGLKWFQLKRGDYETVVAPAPPDGADDASETAVLRWQGEVTDAPYDQETGDLGDGLADVGDGRVTFDITPKDELAQVLVRWERGSERCDAVLRGEQPGVALFVDGLEVARAPDVTLPVGEATRVRFSQVDRVLRLEIGGRLVLRHDLDAPLDPKLSSPGAEVSVRVPRGSVRILPVRLERDVHWTNDYESLGRERLGPDEFFMLGDNSSNSQDSRYRGPVHRSRLGGTPLLIVWPLSRFHVPR